MRNTTRWGFTVPNLGSDADDLPTHLGALGDQIDATVSKFDTGGSVLPSTGLIAGWYRWAVNGFGVGRLWRCNGTGWDAVTYPIGVGISTQAFGDTPAGGVANDGWAASTHVHGMPANPVTAHVAASDPHSQYALDTDLTSYVPKSLVTTKGDLIVATASGAVARVAAGANNLALLADSAQTAGVKWGVPPGTLIGSVQYAPASNTNIAMPAVAAALDATNLTVSFTSPPSGKILVRQSAQLAAGGQNGWWGLFIHGAATLLGLDLKAAPPAGGYPLSVVQIVTVTPNIAYQLDWAGQSQSATSSINVQGTQAANNPTGGPAVMEVYAA